MAAPSPDEKAIRQEVHTNSDLDDITPTPSSALDDSYEVYKQGRDINIGTSEAKSVRRKIDWHVMPILLVTYGLNYLDKTPSVLPQCTDCKRVHIL
jgi:hypothetical protein